MPLPSLGTLSLRDTPKISDQEFKELRDHIYSLTGIDIPAERKYLLENRLGARLKELGLKSFGDYARHLRLGTGRDAELEKLFERVTTNETSFFRDLKQLDVVRDKVLPEIVEQQQKAGTKEISIWSAGCSSGEEPYTLGIMLHEMLRMSIIGWRIRITANDLSPAMLAKARAGLYNDHALRTTPKDVVDRYFTKEAGGYRIHPKVQKLVSFGPINLNDSLAVKRVPRSQVVFCRNVIIYFDEDMKKKVISGFYDNLHPEGFLVLGHSESIHKISRAFTPLMQPGGIVYKKQG
ncbi:MAG: protein-glutamate O-methyltransferase CheR [Thermodesulfobacteriota bacterium]